MSTGRTYAIAGGTAALAFWGAFGLSRFYDDWEFASAATSALASGAIVAHIWSPLAQHWSPLWHAFEIAYIAAFGWQSDVFIRCVTLLLAIASLLLFFRVAARLGRSATAAVVGAAVLGLHPVNGIPYYAFDAYAQMAADLLSWVIAAAALAIGWNSEGRSRSMAPLVITGGYVVALLIKEQALAAFAVVTIIVLWFQFVDPARVAARRALWTTWISMAVATLVFTLLRVRAGVPISGEDAFRLCATCVPANVSTIAGALLVPMRTMPVYLALTAPNAPVPFLTLVVMSVLAVTLGIVGGLRRLALGHWQSDAKRVALVVALLVASTCPTALLAHVGELYAHTALFWFAMLVAFSIDGWQAAFDARPSRWRTGAAFVVAGYITALATGLRLNLNEMRATGERAAVLQTRFQETTRNLPAGSTVVLKGLDRVKGPDDYSLYRLTTPGMLIRGAALLPLVGSRGLTIVDDGDWPSGVSDVAGSGRIFVATFNEDHVSVRDGRP